jgi:hypothetical protein
MRVRRSLGIVVLGVVAPLFQQGFIGGVGSRVEDHRRTLRTWRRARI